MQKVILTLSGLVLLVEPTWLLKGAENSSRFVPAQVISTAEALYPPNVVNPGTVVLEVTVEVSGEIESVKVVRDAPGFTRAAQTAIHKWKFRPARLDGQPVRSTIPVAFSFGQPLITMPH